MNYFLTHRLYSPISAIEKMMLDRIKIFRKHDQSAVFVTRDYDREVEYARRKFELPQASYLNMFDYFQGADDKTVAQPDPKSMLLHDSIETSQDGLNETFFQNGYATAVVQYRQVDHSINTISYYDQAHRLSSVDLYDPRGWISMTQLLDEQARVQTQLFWDTHHGLTYVERYGFKASGEWGNLSMQLLFHGQVRFFESLEQLFAYFLDDLTEQDAQARFFADRHETAVESLTEMAKPATKYLVMHSTHLDGNQLNIWVRKAVEAQFSGIIVSTDKQAQDLRQLVSLPVLTVPVRYLADAELNRPHVPIGERPEHTILVVARLSEEKRIGDAIQALKLVLRDFSDAKLNIFGAPMAGYAEQRKLLDQVRQLKLEDHVNFKGFRDDLDDIYTQGQVMAVTSKVEGFNVSILEALSYGVPVVTYAIDYGPTTLVIDGQNGAIVSQNTPEQLAQVVTSLFYDQARLARLSTGAYGSAKRYSEAEVWKKWAKIIAHN
ncbi:glycosyltransferase [Lactiplantibacillus plantarum]|uniref:glycosyltransferase n=1 Tax=Lactiplantibacillus plantarum TaxID=1590 RepID=UPI001CA44890|nr:glycosyltransferase [Lactiplantibacillus plantarum]MBY8576095.1 glycosyltransferase [Lactiplantibacillus plantarum]